MNCLFFRDKSKAERAKSAPELAGNSGSRNSPGPISTSPHKNMAELYMEKEHNLRVFTLDELLSATNGFSKQLKVGEGGFGSVYKGSVPPADGKGGPVHVAVKKLNKSGNQGHKQWVREVQFLGVVDHPNLVKLVGYCAEDGERGIQRLLVYEFMSNKSLEHHILSRTSAPLPWITRLNLILGAAQGLAYLHQGLELQVIHRDFKLSNILLDDDFIPKLSDFGLAREGPTGMNTHVSTERIGTRGYVAPEYAQTGHLTVKSDMWSFGVVLLEMMTGRRTVEMRLPKGEQRLVEWVKKFPVESSRFRLVMDPRVKGQYSMAAARRIRKLADRCLHKNPRERPTMGDAIEVLLLAVQESNIASTSAGSDKSMEQLPITLVA